MLERYEELLRRLQVDDHDRPAVVFLSAAGLGDFVLQNVVSAALVRRFSRPVRSIAFLREGPDYAPFVVACNPYINSVVTTPAGAAHDIPLDWFDVGMSAPVQCGDPAWGEGRLQSPRLFLVPTMLRQDASRLAGLAESPPGLAIGPREREALWPALENAGLERNRWFVCLHVRTGPDGDKRAADPLRYLEAIAEIALDHGGQVARLGKPDAPPLDNTSGIVQAAAVAAARFFAGNDSGFLALASAFRVPVAGTDLVAFADRVWNQGDVVLAKHIEAADGRLLGTTEAYEAGMLDRAGIETLEYRDNTADDIRAVARHMVGITSDCRGWRESPPQPEVEPWNALAFPLPLRDRPLVRFWD